MVQERETFSHIVSIAMKQGAVSAGTQPIFSFLFSL